MNHHGYFPVVVEDDDDFALLLTRAFVKVGVPERNVRRYADGEAALTALGTVGVLMPSFMTLDIELPGMSGLSVLKQIRAQASFVNLPAFFLSGREDPGYVTEAYALRANGYWVKPSETLELQEVVTAIVGSIRQPGPSRLPGCLPNPWTC